MRPLVSVVIVNFNSGSTLQLALEALPEGLCDLEWEAVVIDNASTDGSERAAEGVDRIRLVKSPANAGFAAGMNVGIRASAGPFVLVLNPDCRLLPGAGRLLIEEGQKHQKCAVIAPRILDPAGTLQESARGDPNMLTGLFGRTTIGSRLFPRFAPARRNLLSASLAKTTESSHPVDWVSGACMLVRRDSLVGVHGFDEGYFLYWEDADFVPPPEEYRVGDPLYAGGDCRSRRGAIESGRAFFG